MKTIKQIADEIGVSKQAVYKRVKGTLHTVIAPYAHTVDGMIYIEDEGEVLIIQAFSEISAYKGAHTDVHTGAHTVDGEIIRLLQDNIAVLQGQLEVKDRQIAELTATVRAQAESINADRHNELAGTIIDGKKQLTDGGEPAESAMPSKRFFARIFGRKSY